MTENLHSIQELRNKLLKAKDKGISRAEAAKWAAAQGGGYGEPCPYGKSQEGRLAWDALNALKVSHYDSNDPSEVGCKFIRDIDLTEWVATMDRIDWPEKHPLGITVKRWHQVVVPLEYAFTIAIHSHEVKQAIGLEHLRGVDDLDMFNWMCFEDHKGRDVMLTWYEYRGYPDAIAYLKPGCDIASAIDDFLMLLNLPKTALTHQISEWERTYGHSAPHP